METYNRVVAHLPERVDRGRYLFLLSLAGFLRDRLRAHAPEVHLNGTDQRYAEDLRIALVQGGDQDEDAVAIYFAHQTAVLAEGQAPRSALYVRPHSASPGWVSVLTRWGPWPAELLPVQLAPNDARVILRTARPDEIQALTRRIQGQRERILAELLEAGAKSPKLERTVGGQRIEVQQDLAHAVLRREFGLDGDAPRAHWRPAIVETLNAVPDALRRLERYVETGRENVFVLPDVEDRISMDQLRAGAPFMAELAPFVPRR
ncbi:MAG: hypothetical protein WC683_01735 [bacterium]